MERDITYDKKTLRAEVIARRNAIPADERAVRSRALCERLLDKLAQRLPPGSTVAAYAALGSETSLTAFLQGAYERGWRVALPCMLKAAEVAQPVEGAVGIPFPTTIQPTGSPAAARPAEPSPHMEFLQVGRATFDALDAPFLTRPARALPADDPALARFPRVAPPEMSAVIVPMVAFDDELNRLGYGGGNYDRFLGALDEDTLVIGVAFEEQRVPTVPLEPHDLPLPRIMRA